MALRDLVTKGLIFVSSFGAVKAQDMPIATLPMKPVLELKDSEPVVPKMVPEYNDGIPTWRELFDQGKLQFTASSHKIEMLDPDKEALKYVHAMQGVGHVIDVMLRDPKYGKKLAQAIEHQGALKIHLEDFIDNGMAYDGGLQLNLLKDNSFILHAETGKVVPLSKSHIVAHELLHYLHTYTDTPRNKEDLIKQLRIPGYKGSEEGRTVAETDDFMRRNFGEPFAREAYVTATTIDSLTHLQPDYYQVGEEWSLSIEDLPDAKLYLEEIKKGMLAPFINKEWSKVSDITTFGKAAQHYRKYLEIHGEAYDLKEFETFVEKAPRITKEYAQLIAKVIEATKDNEVTPQEIRQLEKLDKKLPHVALSYGSPKNIYLAALDEWMTDTDKIKFTVDIKADGVNIPWRGWESSNATWVRTAKPQQEKPEIPNIPKGPSRF